MTQSQITTERAELAVKASAIAYALGMLDAKKWTIEIQQDSLLSSNAKIVARRVELTRLENEMRRAGEWEG